MVPLPPATALEEVEAVVGDEGSITSYEVKVTVRVSPFQLEPTVRMCHDELVLSNIFWMHVCCCRENESKKKRCWLRRKKAVCFLESSSSW